VTIFAPLIAELDDPIPISIVIFVTVVGFIVSFFFPDYDKERWPAAMNMC
jgi:hypothetical protein